LPLLVSADFETGLGFRIAGATTFPREMAVGALKHSKADVAVAVTGVAGPGGGSDAKPVGLVYLAVARRGSDPAIERHQFHGDRAAVRQATVERALEMLAEAVA